MSTPGSPARGLLSVKWQEPAVDDIEGDLGQPPVVPPAVAPECRERLLGQHAEPPCQRALGLLYQDAAVQGPLKLL